MVSLREFRCAFQVWKDRSDHACIFIIGTGRSGTHLLAETLASVPSLRVLMEKQPLFRWSTAMALDERLETTLFPRWVRRFQLELFAAAPRVVVDKSHPNIWIAERLVRAFPSALFLGTRRGPHATVASMLQHGGFSSIASRNPSLPLPNRFLGIESVTLEAYAGLTLPEQFTLRWLANERRFQELRTLLGPKLLEVEYERFVCSPQETCNRVKAFLQIDGAVMPPVVSTASLTKWQKELTRQQVAAIDALLCQKGFGPAATRLNQDPHAGSLGFAHEHDLRRPGR